MINVRHQVWFVVDPLSPGTERNYAPTTFSGEALRPRLTADPEPLLLVLLLRVLDQRLVRLLELLIDLGLLALLSNRALEDHDHACRPLGLGGSTELSARVDEEEGDVVVLAEYGDVGDDVRGRDVAGDDDDAGEGGVGRGGGGGLAEGLHDFFDAALEGVGFGGCEMSVSDLYNTSGGLTWD